jgi:hypothetical protein
LRATVKGPSFWAAAHDQLSWAMSRTWARQAGPAEQRAAQALLTQLEAASGPDGG